MNFKSIFAGAAAVAGALALFTGCGESADNNTLVLATEATFPPYEFRSAGQIVGVDIDYETLGSDNGMLMVTASGTAVRFSPVS